jgi:hypothetical protein
VSSTALVLTILKNGNSDVTDLLLLNLQYDVLLPPFSHADSLCYLLAFLKLKG